MKKLFIVAAAIALSVAVNASTVTWGANNSSAIDATKITTGTFYLMYASDATAVDLSKFASETSFSAASLAKAGLDTTFDTFDYSSSTFQKKNTGITPSSTGVSAGNGLTVYEVLISSDGDYIAYGTTTMNLAGATGMNQGKALAASAFTYVPKAADIPEPTSGLLLLVGGAMLALRRRRA